MYQIAIEAASMPELARLLTKAALAINSQADPTTPEPMQMVDEPPVKRGRKPKAKVEEVEETEDELEETDEDELDEVDEDEVEDEIEEKEVIKAFQNFVKENSTEEGLAILKKLNVKRVTHLKPAQYAKALKLLGA